MRVYNLYTNKYDYDQCHSPNDMRVIMCYLEEIGEVLVSASTIETLYIEFSCEQACGWLTVDEKNLQEFSQWLSTYEI